MIDQRSASILVSNMLLELRDEIAVKEGLPNALLWHKQVQGVCIENGVVTCINGDDPAPPELAWLIPYLNARLHPDKPMALAHAVARTMKFPAMIEIVPQAAPPIHDHAAEELAFMQALRRANPPKALPTKFMPHGKEKPDAQAEATQLVRTIVSLVKLWADEEPITSARLLELLETGPKDQMPPKAAWPWLVRYFAQRSSHPFGELGPNVVSHLGADDCRYWRYMDPMKTDK